MSEPQSTQLLAERDPEALEAGAAGSPPLAVAAMPEEGRDQQIARRAYELYCQRGGDDGGDIDDWLAAEREIDALG